MLHEYWKWDENTVPHDVCSMFVERYDDKLHKGTVADGSMMTDIRVSDVVMVGDEDVKKIFLDFCNTANDNAFGFNTYPLLECQYTKYNGSEGGRYKWHIDLAVGNRKASDRKISCIIMLSDPDEYEGGDFYLGGEKIELAKGSVIAFPSFLAHQVTEVTKGTRRTFVAWQSGPKFI